MYWHYFECKNDVWVAIVLNLLTTYIWMQALDKTLSEKGYGCLERNIPILCFGDGKDMELTLCSDSNSQMPLGTRVSHMTHTTRKLE